MGNKAIKFKNKNNDYIYPCPYFPIGSVYISVAEVNPSNFFGGTWEQIKDKFLLSAGDIYKAGNTGGEATHKMTVDEMPTHSHGLNKNVPYGIPYNDTNGTACGAGAGVFYHESYNPFTINNTGGNKAHNNMPPYLAVYMWKRTK